MSTVTRFAPSPTGFLHLGHAYSAWCNWRRGGVFRLRLEDIDSTRCRPEFTAAMLEDLRWLGLHWQGDIRVQSEHFQDYRKALESLAARGLLYPCFCSRRELALSAPHAATPLYPGTCKHLCASQRADKIAAGVPYALRLHGAQATAQAGPLVFFEEAQGWITARPERLGDVVLARKDTPASYHLCVVHDDALQGITHVIRGQDLAESTQLHVLLQRLLGLPTPIYAHHRLLLDAHGKRLAKRDGSQNLAALRQSGIQPQAILARFEDEA